MMIGHLHPGVLPDAASCRQSHQTRPYQIRTHSRTLALMGPGGETKGLAVNLLIAIVLALLASLLTGCQGNSAGNVSGVPAETRPRINPPAALPKALDKFPQIDQRNKDVPADYQAVAENDSLRLYVRKASSAIIVEDKRSGHLWRSSPAGLADNKGTTTAWRRQIEIPIQVAYVDPDRSQPKVAKTDRGFSMALKPVQDGAQVTYTFETLKLAFGIIYSLRGDCMEATIPEKTVAETGPNGLATIDLLAFLGATMDGEDGYIVYPDGSGALMHFNTNHPADIQKINTVIYGSDASGGMIGNTASNFREQVSMPVFGLATGKGNSSAAFVGMVTQGDFDASLGVARSGKGVNYNHVWTTFIFRRQGRFSITGGQPAWLFQPDRITGDRTVRYCFLNGKNADYVGMAARYRDFLITERGAGRVGNRATGAGEKAADAVAEAVADSGAPLMHLGFLMGTERKTWFLADMISMTTFAEARDILNDLAKAGVKRLDVSLWFWDRGGTSLKYPQHLPADPRLGGDQALTALAADIHQRGQRLFLQEDYLSVAPGAPGVMPYLDAVRGVDGLPIGGADTGYLLNPQISLRSYAGKDIPRMALLGADGLEIQTFARMTLPDKNTRYPLSRESFAASWMQIAQLSRKQLGAVALDGNNIYAVPYADRLDFVSIDSTHFDVFDEAVPFYHIAVHGLVQYTYNAYNLVSDGKRIFLQQVEVGAMPMFVVTSASSAQLMRTNLSSIYSSQYSFWRDEIIRQYKAVEQLAPLADQFITGHARLAPDVYQTTYQDGSRVIVNYGSEPYQAGAERPVPAQDFIVVRGD